MRNRTSSSVEIRINFIHYRYRLTGYRNRITYGIDVMRNCRYKQEKKLSSTIIIMQKFFDLVAIPSPTLLQKVELKFQKTNLFRKSQVVLQNLGIIPQFFFVRKTANLRCRTKKVL